MNSDSRYSLGICHAIYGSVTLCVALWAGLVVSRRTGWLVGAVASLHTGVADLLVRGHSVVALGVMITGLLLSFPSLAAAFALLSSRSWERPCAIAAACVSLLAFPFGTAVSLLTLWLLVLSPRASVQHKAHSSVSDTFR